MTVSRIDVAAPGGSYVVHIGPGLLADVGPMLAQHSTARLVALMTDVSVAALYADVVERSLSDAGFGVVRVVVPAGEESKSWAQAGEVLERFAVAGLDRRDAVVALGGGVVGDLAGFCAASYMRGVAFAQIPTTLLSQVDSAIGGKTGVDLEAGKNLAGAFWQPLVVIEDTSVLSTLSETEWRSGLAEVVKAAFLLGEEDVAWLEASASALTRREPPAVEEAVRRAVAFKAGVVSADERESGLRECLNYGHTLGHAIEKVAGYGVIAHGLAVAEGIRFAALLAETALGSPDAWTQRQEALLDALGLGAISRPWDTGALRSAMSADKKSVGGTPRFVLSDAPGSWRVMTVPEQMLETALARWASDTRR